MSAQRMTISSSMRQDRYPAVHPAAPPRLNWHALRHFAISCWIDAELTPKTVQTFAGHSTLAVTMDRYGHLFKSDDHRIAMDAIARQFAVEEPDRPDTAPEANSEPTRHDPEP
jgi:integrase